MTTRELSPELAKRAAKELGEDPQRLADGIKNLKEWIAKQPHLVNNVRTDDQWLAAFLRGCKFRIEMAKKKFDTYYTLRSALPELDKPMDPFSPAMQKIMNSGLTLMLPKGETPDSPRILLSRTYLLDSSKITMEENSIFNQMLFFYLLMEDDNAVISGLDMIVDVKDTSLDIANRLTVPNVKKAKIIAEKGLPFRYKGAYYINVLPAAETLFGFLRGFMNDKSRRRLFVHADVDPIFEKFPKHLLPKEYGGDSYTIQELIEDNKKRIESIGDLLREEINYKSNEKLRPGKPITGEQLFGTDGNFRQLNFD